MEKKPKNKAVKTGKKEGGVVAAGAKCMIKSAICMVISMLVASYIAMRSEDPAKSFFICSVISCAVGGIACAAFSAAESKSDGFLCSVISGAFLTAAVAAGSLFFDNAGKAALMRVIPALVIMICSVLFGMLINKKFKRKRRSVR